MSSRELSSLRPNFRTKVNEFLVQAAKAELDILVYCCFRSLDEQTQLYAIGRTKPGKIVTNAKAGESAHNYGMAFDGAPLINGKIAWEDHPHWILYGEVAKSVGLEWAGDWPSFKEFPHIQLPNWRSYVIPTTQAAK